jgi:SOS-response transcriptional repressor LexA
MSNTQMLKGEMLGKAIAEAIAKKGVSKKKLAEDFGIKPPSVQDWIKRGTIGRDNLFKLIDYFADVCAPSFWGVSNSGDDQYGAVPIITWEQAATRLPGVHIDDDETIPCPKLHSPNTFALRVRTDAMTAPYGKSYPEGSVIFVNPDDIEPQSGDRIIARVENSPRAVFNVFMQEGTKAWLKPLNPQYPVIMGVDFRIIGKVIGKWEDE